MKEVRFNSIFADSINQFLQLRAAALKEKTISGMLWSAMERFGYMFVMFVSNLFLARLLSPD